MTWLMRLVENLFLLLVWLSTIANAHANDLPSNPPASNLEQRILTDLSQAADAFRANAHNDKPGWRWISYLDQDRASTAYRNAVDEAILAATGGNQDLAAICNELSYRYSRGYAVDYSQTSCFRIDRPLFYTGRQRYEKQSEAFESLHEANMVLIRWLVRNDGSELPYNDSRRQVYIAYNSYLDASNAGKPVYPRELEAILKLQAENFPLEEYVISVTIPEDHYRLKAGDYYFIRDPSASKILMAEAFQWYTEDTLPSEIAGVDTRQALEFFKSWLPNDEGLKSIMFDVRDVLYFSVPALELLITQFRSEIDRVYRENWIAMPIETASLLALREIQVTQNVDLKEFAFTTPSQLYIDPSRFGIFMNLYRGNKQAFIADEVGAKISELQVAVAGELAEIRTAIESNAEVTAAMGQSLKSIKNAAWLATIISGLSFINTF